MAIIEFFDEGWNIKDKALSKIISYPRYCPDKFGLRALLLFYDDISTIVPYDDQNSVLHREHVQEISDITRKSPITPVDPSYSTFTWEYDEQTFGSFKKLAKAASQRITPDLRVSIRKALNEGHSWHEPSINDVLQDAGWSFIAAPKITPGTLDELKEMDVALPTHALRHHETQEIVEQEPILMPSELVDFAISRLARDIGKQGQQVPVTLENSPHYASLYRGGISLPDKRHYLVSSLVQASIPECLAKLPSGEYWELRQQYAGVRLKLNNLISLTMTTHDLDGSNDFGEFLSRSEQVVNQLRSEIVSVANSTRPAWIENTRSFAIDTSFALTGAYVGFALGEFVGAMAGLGLGKLSPKISAYFTTRNDDLTSQIGHMRARITQAARRPKYQVPGYMI